MDSHYEVNLDRIARVIDSVEVLLIRFDTVEKRLLIDLRCHAYEGPFIGLVERVDSLEERVQSLRVLRPDFPPAQQIKVLRWPRYVRSLRTLGVWQQIEARCLATGFPGIPERLCEVYAELQQEEQETMRSVITGEGFTTVWERTS